MAAAWSESLHMSDRLFYGNFFFENCPVTMTVIIIYMLMSLIPSMF